jgi:hypothetical protein
MYGNKKYIDALVKCQNCKFIFQDPIIKDGSNYERASISKYLALSKYRKQYFNQVKNIITEKYLLNNPKSILDLGAGSGEWLENWVDLELHATEINPELIKILTAKNVHTYKTLSAVNKKMDIISAFDFLEHVNDPNNLLKIIVEKSNDKTLFVFGVPNMGNLPAKIFRTRYYLYCPMHYSYFNELSLRLILEKYLDNVYVLKAPRMKSDINGVLKWITKDKLRIKSKLSIPMGYSASLIAFGFAKKTNFNE